MDIGDKVMILDGSWSFLYKDGMLKRVGGIELQKMNPYTVLVTGAPFLPTDESGSCAPQKNDTIALAVSGELVFTHHTMCLQCDVCPHCGRANRSRWG